jgi:hypothetical protein
MGRNKAVSALPTCSLARWYFCKHLLTNRILKIRITKVKFNYTLTNTMWFRNEQTFGVRRKCIRWLQTVHSPANVAFDVTFTLFIRSLYKKQQQFTTCPWTVLVRDIVSGILHQHHEFPVKKDWQYMKFTTVTSLSSLCKWRFTLFKCKNSINVHNLCFKIPKSSVTNFLLSVCKLLCSHLWRNVKTICGIYTLFREEFSVSYVPRIKVCHVIG